MSPAVISLCGSPCKHVVRWWAQKQGDQNEVPVGCEPWAPSLARSPFHLLASWLHLYLRKDRELCSGNVNPLLRPCSSQADGQVWKECFCWQEFDGAQAQMEVTFLSVLSLLWGRSRGGRGCSAGRGVQSKLSQFQPAATCQWSLTTPSGSVSVDAGNVPSGEGGVTSGRRSKPSVQVRNKLQGLGVPCIYSPKQGRFPPCAVRHSPVLTVTLSVPFASVSSQKAFRGK